MFLINTIMPIMTNLDLTYRTIQLLNPLMILNFYYLKTLYCFMHSPQHFTLHPILPITLPQRVLRFLTFKSHLKCRICEWPLHYVACLLGFHAKHFGIFYSQVPKYCILKTLICLVHTQICTP